MSEDLLRLYGTSERAPESRRLAAGDLAVMLQDGNLRTLRFRGHEVLRGVAFLVRDRDWGTCNAVITGLAVEETEQGFSVGYLRSTYERGRRHGGDPYESPEERWGGGFDLYALWHGDASGPSVLLTINGFFGRTGDTDP